MVMLGLAGRSRNILHDKTAIAPLPGLVAQGELDQR
jgi:hypothetical protein